MDTAQTFPEPAAPPVLPQSLPLASWLREGWRAGFFLKPRVAGYAPHPWQIAALFLIVSLVEIGIARLEVPGPANFDLRGWLGPWSLTAALLLLAWWALSGRSSPGGRPLGLAAWYGLWLTAVLPVQLVSQGLGVLEARGWGPQALQLSGVTAWAVYLAFWAWTIAVLLRLFWHFGVNPGKLAIAGIAAVSLFALTTWQFADDHPWRADLSQSGAPERPRLALSQELFMAQQALWERQVAALAPQRPGIADVYGLVFSPYASQDVFLRESTMVASVLAERFDAHGRVLQLVNHVATAETHAWATPLNLTRAIEALAARMDLENDILVVYLTSHGASDFKLAAYHWPLTVGPVGPAELRRALDDAGIRHRVVAVSACYAGGWVAPLAGDHTLVMTAADAEHTSYGCGRKSELTFFGRAVFDEGLRNTHSFEQAFAAAVPLIRQRELDAGKDDGFSNPQLSVGDKLRPVLRALEQRLAAPSRQPG